MQCQPKPEKPSLEALQKKFDVRLASWNAEEEEKDLTKQKTT